MPRILAWNGGAWVNPAFRVSSTWKSFTPATAGPMIFYYEFNSNTAEGWTYYHNPSNVYVPANPTGAGEIYCNGGGAADEYDAPSMQEPALYLVSDMPAHVTHVQLHGTIRGDLITYVPSDSPIWFAIGFYYGNQDGIYAAIEATASFGHIAVASPLIALDTGMAGWRSMSLTCYTSTYIGNTESNMNLVLDRIHLLDQNGAGIYLEGDPGFQPKFWDGAQWLTVNS